MNKILIYEKLNALHTHTYIYNAIVIQLKMIQVDNSLGVNMTG